KGWTIVTREVTAPFSALPVGQRRTKRALSGFALVEGDRGATRLIGAIDACDRAQEWHVVIELRHHGPDPGRPARGAQPQEHPPSYLYPGNPLTNRVSCVSDTATGRVQTVDIWTFKEKDATELCKTSRFYRTRFHTHLHTPANTVCECGTRR